MKAGCFILLFEIKGLRSPSRMSIKYANVATPGEALKRQTREQKKRERER
jgi:hypothetical protein